jgi:ABC-type cobalamin/Fe3+-siderophores transport system ATPase subunit
MTFDLNISQSSGTPLIIPVNIGNILFILGANGTGKSSLMLSFFNQNRNTAKRISAHRQTWFDNNAINMTAQSRRDMANNELSWNQQPNARYIENGAIERTNVILYDVINYENARARRVMAELRNDQINDATKLAKEETPLESINEIFRLSCLPIKLSIKDDEQVIASKNGGLEYSIAEMSDGERNAMLIAMNVLTAKAGSLILIDEPERHLHRSIISPLLSTLFSKRPDCAFVVSTHELMLPLDNTCSKTVLVRGCDRNGAPIISWDVDLMEAGCDVDDEVKKEILGSRKKILFVEGTEQSLDKPLYSIIFPDISVIAKSSCHDVENAVLGIRGNQNLNWVSAFGIVDNDNRPTTDIEALKTKGIYALPVFSVESIYYNPDIQRRVVERLVETIGGDDATTRLANAKSAALLEIESHIPRLSSKLAEKTVREAILNTLPRKGQIAAAQPISFNIDVAEIISAERQKLQYIHNQGNLSEIIEKHPVRETPALNKIAEHLGFQNRKQYESAVIKLLIDDAESLSLVKGWFGSLPVDITT